MDMNTMRFGLMRAAFFSGLVLAGVLMHAGQASAEVGAQPPLATSVRAQADKAQAAIKVELASELKAGVRDRVAADEVRKARFAAAIEAAATAAPVASLGLVSHAYGAVNTL